MAGMLSVTVLAPTSMSPRLKRTQVRFLPVRRAPAGSLSNVTSNGAPPPSQHCPHTTATKFTVR
jgi:hypothetical protein